MFEFVVCLLRRGWLTGVMVSPLLGCPDSEGGVGRDMPDAGETLHDAAVSPAPHDAAHSSDAMQVGGPMHSALLSIQEVTIAAAEARGLTVQVLITKAVPPSYEEMPGAATGCKVWSYDLAESPPPALEDHGSVKIFGLKPGALDCHFAGPQGYVCTTPNGEVGPVPGALHDVFVLAQPIRVEWVPNVEQTIVLPPTELSPSTTFVPDDRTGELVRAIPLTGEAVTLSCAGAGGDCGEAEASIVRISTTDAPTEGLPALAFPPARKRAVELTCATLGSDHVTIPAEAMAIVRAAHEASPITRIRTAFMRDGVAIVPNEGTSQNTRVVMIAGRGFIGFTNPSE